MNIKVVAVILAFILIGGVITLSQSSDSLSNSDPAQPCEEPLTYTFGDIDPRFNITKEELAKVMNEVEDVWATALDRDLLDYNKNGRVTIHFVYSEDQKRTEAERDFSKQIDIKRNDIEILKQEYKQHRQRFESRKANFQSLVDEYNSSIRSYKNYAEKWSGKNLSTNVRNRLERMKRNISRLESKVNSEQQNLELLRQETNEKSRKLNKFVDEQNKRIADYNARFSSPKKFDQGRYIRQGNIENINIFQFSNHKQLTVVLAHEVGHAFGLDHVGNPESIMNEMMAEQNIFNPQLSDEDIASINKLCSN